MSHPPPIPESLWDTVPPDAQAALMAVFESLRCRIAELQQRGADLEARLQLNSTKRPGSSSIPPRGPAPAQCLQFFHVAFVGSHPPDAPAARASQCAEVRRVTGARPGPTSPDAPGEAAFLHRLPTRYLPALRPSSAGR